MSENNSNSLYRIYRPKTFQDVSGHSNVIKILQNQLIKNNFPHALLFTGQRGTGKTSLARIFAKAVNCTNLIDGIPCGECDNCLAANENKSPDIFEIDAASNNGIEEIRSLKNNITVLPIMGKYKIYIIDEVHMLSKSAFNALLKTLEEPPKHVLFILATTEYAKIPATIISRCQVLNFSKIDKDSLEKRIDFVAKNQGFLIDTDAKEEIYYLSEGSLRDALNILEQLIAVSIDKITLNDLKRIFYVASKKDKISIINNVLNNDSDSLIDYFEKANKEGIDFDVFALSLIEIIKEIIEYKLTKNDKYLNILDLNDVIIFNNIDIQKLFNIADNLRESYSNSKTFNASFDYILLALLKSISITNTYTMDEKTNNYVSSEEEKSTSNILDFQQKNEKSENNINEIKNERKMFDGLISKSEPIFKNIISKDSIDQFTNDKEKEVKTLSELIDYQNELIIRNSNKKHLFNVSSNDVITMLSGAKKDNVLTIQSIIDQWFKTNDEGTLLQKNKAKNFVAFNNSKVAAVSSNEILLKFDNQSSTNYLNSKLFEKSFRNKIYKEFGQEYTIFVVDKTKLELIKKDFIIQKQNNKLPNYSKTNSEEFYNNLIVKNKSSNSKNEQLLNDALEIFGTDDLEIEE